MCLTLQVGFLHLTAHKEQADSPETLWSSVADMTLAMARVLSPDLMSMQSIMSFCCLKLRALACSHSNACKLRCMQATIQ